MPVTAPGRYKGGQGLEGFCPPLLFTPIATTDLRYQSVKKSSPRNDIFIINNVLDNIKYVCSLT